MPQPGWHDHRILLGCEQHLSRLRARAEREDYGDRRAWSGTGNYLGTIAASINVEGTIPGYFVDPNGVAHGFVRTRSGEFTTFDAPGASGIGTAAFSINLFGAVTGEFFDANNVMHGFSRLARGVFAEFDAPDAGTGAFQGTRPSTNNAEEAVAGWYVDANNLNHGFVWKP